MRRRPPRSTRTDTLFPYTTLFRSVFELAFDVGQQARCADAEQVRLHPLDAQLFLHQHEVLQCRLGRTDPAGRFEADLEAGALGELADGAHHGQRHRQGGVDRSEEHTSELQSLMRISYAVFCLKKKKQNTTRDKKT